MAAPAGLTGVQYLRVSDGDKQDRSSQAAAIQRWLDGLGLKTARVYSDSGSRDLSYRRPQFQQLLKDAAAGQFQWIVVSETDRLGSRDAFEYAAFLHQLRESDVELWSVPDGLLNGDDAVSAILASVNGSRSQDEQKARGQRAVRAKIESAKRGDWTGGSPPYAFDAACMDATGKELWRVLYLSRYERVRIWPDGRRERFDGKGNFPGRDHGTVLKLVPSCDEERISWVRKIFAWFATEAISLRALCTRLNAIPVKPIIGSGWYTSRLRPLLENPVYIGTPAWNKQGHGRFSEFIGGQQQPVERIKGRVLTGRKRATSDHVSGAGQAIIDVETWERVQAKLGGIHPTARAPRSSDHWLSGLLVCGGCGRQMSAWALNRERSYTCSTYRQYGASGQGNPTGCYLHRTNATVLASLVDAYLEEMGVTLNCLLAVETEDDLADYQTTDPRILKYMKRIQAIWREVKGSRHHTCDTLIEAYQGIKEGSQEAARQELLQKQAEMAVLAGQLSKQKTAAAIAAISQAMDELGVAIARLEEATKDLSEALAASRQELEAMQRQVEMARVAVRGDEMRQKSEALRQVLGRIVCYYKHHMAGTQRRSTLVEVRFEPIGGEPTTKDLRDGTWVGPGSISQMLSRTYGSEEIEAIRREIS